ncbi:hypothetical protein [Branchiibius sp. NY16-3462-2]|uniref:hypothetical protein n=1 Tax=Branchiibius sp. NY16-3462-2 TaxID=1807500 RepID=UPI00079B7249|nr:hypothetical protein [Branchiibius sp. NY16-3462-2]KYH44843.1 hypothetical protein AZH51_01540 [Branchiibius sp. NY16-3462-2]
MRITIHRPLIAVSAASAVLGLAACGSSVSVSSPSGGTTTSTTSSSSAAPSTSDSPTSSETASSSAQAPSTSAAGGATEGTPGTVTPPGTKLKVGQAAVIHTNRGDDPKDPKYYETTVELSVAKIEKGSESDLSKLENAAKFKGQTPYYITVNAKLLSTKGASNLGVSVPSVDGTLKDGTEAQSLIVFGSLGPCDSKSFKATGSGDNLTIPVGATAVGCTIVLAPTGDEVTGATYDDSRWNYEDYSDNKYRDDPIVWSK